MRECCAEPQIKQSCVVPLYHANVAVHAEAVLGKHSMVSGDADS